MNHMTACQLWKDSLNELYSTRLVFAFICIVIWFFVKTIKYRYFKNTFFCAPDSYTYHIIRETSHFWSLIIFAMFIRRYSLNYYFKSKLEEIYWTFCTLHYTIIRSSRKVNTLNFYHMIHRMRLLVVLHMCYLNSS